MISVKRIIFFTVGVYMTGCLTPVHAAEILVANISKRHADPIEDRRGKMKRHDPISVLQDGHSWGSEELGPMFYIVKIPGMSVEEAEAFIRPEVVMIPHPDGGTEEELITHRNRKVRYNSMAAAHRQDIDVRRSVTITRGQAIALIKRKTSHPVWLPPDVVDRRFGKQWHKWMTHLNEAWKLIPSFTQFAYAVTTTTKTIKSSGGDYSSQGSFESGQDQDLVSNNKIVKGVCYDLDINSATYDGWTTSSTQYIQLEGSEALTGLYDTSKCRIDTSNQGPVQMRENHFRGYDLQVFQKRTDSSTGYCLEFRGTGAVTYEVNRIICKGVNHSSSGVKNLLNIQSCSSGYLKLSNLLSYDCGSGSGCGTFKCNCGECFAYNMNSAACRDGFMDSGGTTTVKNSVYHEQGVSGGDGWQGTFEAESDYNISSQIDGVPGANSDVCECTYEDVANDDYRLTGGGTCCSDSGLDLEGDADYPVTDDLLGTDRTAVATYDIGFFEFGGVPPSIIYGATLQGATIN